MSDDALVVIVDSVAGVTVTGTTVQDIIDRALRPMRDPAQDFFTDDELIEYINEAITDLASRMKLVQQVRSIPLTNGTLSPSTDLIGWRWVRDPESGAEATWVDPSSFFQIQKDDPNRANSAPLATAYEQQVHIHPPTEGDWQVGAWVLPTPATLTTEGIVLPRVWDDKIVQYVRAQCYYRLSELELGDRTLARYEFGLPRQIRTANQNHPGHSVMAIENGPFDRIRDSIHRGS